MDTFARSAYGGLHAVSVVFALATSACGVAQPLVQMTADEIAVAGNAATCDTATGDGVRCHGRVIVDSRGCPHPNPAPAGFGPSQLRSAYKITSSGSSATVIAIVDAFGYPNAEADLATYRTQFGLPSCTTANGCFKKVNQFGKTDSFPPPDLGWQQETAIDLDMVSAMCPRCKLLLVEANSTSFDDIALAEQLAADLGANVISNSYGGDESVGAQYDYAYDYPGVAIVVSTGDMGFGLGIEFPAASDKVVAVGGTTLATASNSRGWTESGWSGSGSGCSAFFAKPSWQKDTGCTGRTLADVSAVADPNTGVAVYGPDTDTTTAWLVFGGTSVAAPIIAGIYGLNGGGAQYGSDPYAHRSGLYDITTGFPNGFFCDPGYLCTPGPGYDGPTGLGTPHGSSAF
jgi:hypothetical protein